MADATTVKPTTPPHVDIVNTLGTVLFTSAATILKDALIEAVSKRADLRGANLRGANLCEANLCEANLCEANLCEANLCEANLRGANLCGANLCGANPRGANLCEANLREANLRGANLYGANLCEANLCEANLRGANLCGASLCGANLRGANLCEANLCEANLRGANNAALVIARLQFIPLEGEFVAWKKTIEGVVKLLIPADAKRSHGTERKCRASKAVVLETPNGKPAHSLNDKKFVYEVGATVIPDSFDENRWETCSHGIHFYVTPEEAEAHV
jgi:uncharacterized protein YjbI with pentapeptide repeats